VNFYTALQIVTTEKCCKENISFTKTKVYLPSFLYSIIFA